MTKKTPLGVPSSAEPSRKTPLGVPSSGRATTTTIEKYRKNYKKSIKYLSKIIKKNKIFGPEEFEQIEFFGTDLGWFGDTLGMVWGYFRTNFEKLEV